MSISVFFDYHNPVCDCCGHILPAERDDAAAEAAMRAEGWQKRGDRDVCRLCQFKERATGRLPGKKRA